MSSGNTNQQSQNTIHQTDTQGVYIPRGIGREVSVACDRFFRSRNMLTGFKDQSRQFAKQSNRSSSASSTEA